MDTQKKNKMLKNLKSMGVFWALVVLFVAGCIISPKFATSGNMINVARQISNLTI